MEEKVLSLGPTPEEINARLVSHMEATRKRDKVFTIIIVLVAGIALSLLLGCRQVSELGVIYYSSSWDWRFGLPAAIAPWIFATRLYRQLRAKRSRRFFVG